MTVHTIRMPDRMRGRELRTVIWDDEAGTVSGDHSDVPWLLKMIGKPTPWSFPLLNEEFLLRDPAHNPSEFVFLLGRAYWPILDPDRDLHRLPPALRDAEPLKFRARAEPRPGLLF